MQPFMGQREHEGCYWSWLDTHQLSSLGKVFRSKIFKDVRKSSNSIMLSQVSKEKM